MKLAPTAFIEEWRAGAWRLTRRTPAPLVLDERIVLYVASPANYSAVYK